MVLASIIALGLSSALAADANEPRCPKLVEKALSDARYGSFHKPKSGVSKVLDKDGTWVFDSPGGQTLRIMNDKIMTTSNFMGGVPMAVTMEFDQECNVTSVFGSTMGGTMPLTVKADPNECKTLLARAKALSPLATMGEQLSLIYCGQYFANKPAAQDSQDKGAGAPAKALPGRR